MRGRCDLVPEPPGEFDITPDRDAALSRPGDERVVRGVPGRHNDELRVEGGQVGRDHLAIWLRVVSRSDHGEEINAFLVGLGGDHQHRTAKFGQRVGGGESSGTQPEHRHSQRTPVGVPAGQLVEIPHGYWLTHSR